MPNTIAENLERLKSSRTNIGTTIVNMGGTVASGDGFEEFSYDISTIPSGGGGEAIPCEAALISFGTSDSNVGNGTIEVI
jgi:hypothetical protein